MKRFLSAVLTVILLISSLPLSALAEGVNSDFNEKLMSMINQYDTGNYYSEIIIDPQENTIQKDDEAARSLEEYDIDMSAVASTEELIPAVPVLEAMGKSAELDEESGTITVTDDGETQTLDLSQTEIDSEDVVSVSTQNGVATIETEDFIAKDPVGYFSKEQAEETFAAEVVHTDDDKIIISNPFQTKRLIVERRTLGTIKRHGAVACVNDGGYYVLQYKTEAQAKKAFEFYRKEQGADCVSTDNVLKISSFDNKIYGKQLIQSDRYINELKQNGKSSSVKVAVVDTGADATHPLIKSRLLKGYNVFSKKSNATDDNMHGTHVSGIIASSTPSNVKILPVKVLNSGGYGTDLTVKTGIEYATKQKVQVINMSLGGICSDNNCPIKKAIDAAVKAGVTVVVAAGNDSANTKHFCPAKLKNCVTVSACDMNGALTSFTNFGDAVDICAPGHNIYSSVPGGGYEYAGGTSMAAPFVSAAAALLYVNNTSIKPAQCEQLLREYSCDMLTKGWDKYTGFGLLNLGIALGDKDLPADWFSVGGVDISVKLFSKISPYFMQVSSSRRDEKIPTDRSVSFKTTNKNVAYFDGKYIQFTGAGECEVGVDFSTGSTRMAVKVDKIEVWIDYAAKSYAAGNGTSKNPYQIKTAAHLAKFALDIRNGNRMKGKHFKLMNDINLAGKKWISAYCFITEYSYIESSSYYDTFQGTFDGNHHKILNMETFNEPLVSSWFDSFAPVNSQWYMENGSFLGALKGAVIKNLGIENARCETNGFYGVLAAEAYENTTISGCYTSGTTFGSGLIGNAFNYNVNISNCYSSARVYRSGICGNIGSSMQKGGITFKNVFFCGELISNDISGGNSNFVENLIAYKGYPYIEMYNCFSAALNPGGVGFANNIEYSKIYNSYYYNGNSTAWNKAIGSSASLKAKPLSFFKTKASYTSANWNSKHLWDFKNTWAIDSKINNGFPYLKHIKPGKATVEEKTGTWADYAAKSFAEGNGKKSSPYLIESAEQLARISLLYRYGGGKGVYFKLIKDIDLSAHAWLPIGVGKSLQSLSSESEYFDMKRMFSGHIDGAGHTITGMHVYAEGAHIGFISKLYNSTVQNLHFAGADVQGKEYVGILCGENSYHGNIVNCSVEGKVDDIGENNTAFLAGCNRETATVKGCSVKVSGIQQSSAATQALSGIVAENGGIIEQCSFNAEEDTANRYTLCLNNNGLIKNCFGLAANIYFNALCAERCENCYLANSTSYILTGKLFDKTHRVVEKQTNTIISDFAEFDNSFWQKSESALPTLKTPASFKEFVFPSAKWEAAGSFAGGKGTKTNPYLIATPGQLARLRDYFEDYKGKYFRLIRDLDLSSKIWNDDPFNMSSIAKFVLDGNHKTIKNPIIKDSYGLFNFDFDGLIRDLNVVNIQGTAGSGLVTNNNGTIRSCRVSGVFSTGTDVSENGVGITYLGGICSSNRGLIEKCEVDATFFSMNYAGAIAYDNDGEIRNCRADGLKVCGNGSVVHLKNDWYTGISKETNCFHTINGAVPDEKTIAALDTSKVWNPPKSEGEFPTLKDSTEHYTITYELGGGKAASNTEYDYTPGSNVILKTPSKANSFFDGWYLDKSLTKKVEQVGIKDKSNITVYAKWLAIGQPKVKAATGVNTVKLSWNKCKNAKYYRVYSYSPATKKYKKLADTTARSYVLGNRIGGTSYYFLVRAYYKDKTGREVISPYTIADNIKAVTLCSAPLLQAVPGKGTVKLKWKAVHGAQFYRVYEYSAKSGKYSTVVSKVKATSCTLKGLKKGKHIYLLRAFNVNDYGSKYTAKNRLRVTVK